MPVSQVHLLISALIGWQPFCFSSAKYFRLAIVNNAPLHASKESVLLLTAGSHLFPHVSQKNQPKKCFSNYFDSCFASAYLHNFKHAICYFLNIFFLNFALVFLS